SGQRNPGSARGSCRGGIAIAYRRNANGCSAAKDRKMRPDRRAAGHHLTTSIVLIVVLAWRAENFPQYVIAMLPGVEHAPSVLEQPRRFCAEQAQHGRIAVGDVQTGDLVVAVVLETVAAQQRGVYRRGCIAALRNDPYRLVG